MYLLFRNGFEECTIITRGIGRGGPWKSRLFWALKSRDSQGPPLPMPRVMLLHPSKPLCISAIKTTGTLVVLCTWVLFCTIVVCCCVLEGRGGLLVAVLCEQVGAGWHWQASPSPTHYSVGIHGCMLVGGGCYSYIRFDPFLAVSWLAHTTHS